MCPCALSILLHKERWGLPHGRRARVVTPAVGDLLLWGGRKEASLLCASLLWARKDTARSNREFEWMITLKLFTMFLDAH